MNFCVLGVDHRSCPLDERSKFSLNHSPELRKELLQGQSSTVWLSTCNRVEIYSEHDLGDEFMRKWASLAGFGPEYSSFYVKKGSAALRHLFRVSASLESMVLGETQITGQLRRAYDEAVNSFGLSSTMHRLFQECFRVTKRIRSETEVGQFAVSVSSIGVKLSEKVLGDLSGKRIGIIGLGEIGRVAAEHFACIGPREILLYNRTEQKAIELETQFCNEGVVARATSIEEVLKNCSVIVNSVPENIFTDQLLKHLRDTKDLKLCLDLAVPPVFPRELSENCFIYFVDDLERIAVENQKLRVQELESADSIVEEELEKMDRLFASLDFSQTFRRLDEKLGLLRDQELVSLQKKLKHLSDDDWKEIEQMAHRLSTKILRDPIVELKARAQDSDEKDTWLQFFRNIFKV